MFFDFSKVWWKICVGWNNKLGSWMWRIWVLHQSFKIHWLDQIWNWMGLISLMQIVERDQYGSLSARLGSSIYFQVQARRVAEVTAPPGGRPRSLHRRAELAYAYSQKHAGLVGNICNRTRDDLGTIQLSRTAAEQGTLCCLSRFQPFFFALRS